MLKYANQSSTSIINCMDMNCVEFCVLDLFIFLETKREINAQICHPCKMKRIITEQLKKIGSFREWQMEGKNFTTHRQPGPLTREHQAIQQRKIGYWKGVYVRRLIWRFECSAHSFMALSWFLCSTQMSCMSLITSTIKEEEEPILLKHVFSKK